MRRHARTLRLCTAATALAGLAACDHDHDDGDHDHDRAVELRFAAVVGAEPFACTKTFTVGAVELEPLDFRLYVHGVQLVDADGGTWPVTLGDDGLWQDGAVALLDFEDKSGTCVNGTTVWSEQFCFCNHTCGDNGGTCGGSAMCGSTTWGEEHKVAVSEIINHTSASLAVGVKATLDQPSNDESFGIDNVYVYIR